MITKIGVVGAHSTGKTTFVRKLKEYLSKEGFTVYIIEELARRGRKSSLKEFHVQKMIIEEQIRKEREIKEKIKSDYLIKGGQYVLITDRTTIDNFVYLELYGHKEKIINKNLMETIEENNRSYDIIVYIPIQTKASSDGFRDVNELFRFMIDEEIKERLENLKINHNIKVLNNDESIFAKIIEVLIDRENFNTEFKEWRDQ
ncbi:MAG: hypothetical protein EF806_03235 [Candidatus Methanoliparum thermophilum]|uniref:NadR/Ttd14 AAA domain-containing protein n=1 Tax=Methanoliparum thermophilum TaxID=2491083 RepID=A0A520KT36_METT2|nr:AAA family ATPase [Candidatus Methanoliparum sp. LAM-1]RZN65069.1 MAG: hypothetical protein EF806_03235 [Candidatus Methanoliparum thermophilum]BDC36038.1 hypothetical protein MTLP_07200 [Candidatus Methanoliparum sp. LAM-1]